MPVPDTAGLRAVVKDWATFEVPGNLIPALEERIASTGRVAFRLDRPTVVPSVSFNSEAYFGTDAETIITVVDGNPALTDTVTVRVVSSADTEGFNLSLGRIPEPHSFSTNAPGHGNLRFCTDCVSDPANRVLEVSNGSTLTAIYFDGVTYRTDTATWSAGGIETLPPPPPTSTSTPTASTTPTPSGTPTPSHTPSPTVTPS